MSNQITTPKGTINASRDEEDDDVTIPYDSIKVVKAKAVLFTFDGEKVWIPTSQIVDVYPADCEVRMSEWIAGEKGIS
jgi:hypothetical protein